MRLEILTRGEYDLTEQYGGMIDWDKVSGKWDFSAKSERIEERLNHIKAQGYVRYRTSVERGGRIYEVDAKLPFDHVWFVRGLRDDLLSNVRDVVGVKERNELQKASVLLESIQKAPPGPKPPQFGEEVEFDEQARRWKCPKEGCDVKGKHEHSQVKPHERWLANITPDMWSASDKHGKNQVSHAAMLFTKAMNLQKDGDYMDAFENAERAIEYVQSAIDRWVHGTPEGDELAEVLQDVIGDWEERVADWQFEGESMLGDFKAFSQDMTYEGIEKVTLLANGFDAKQAPTYVNANKSKAVLKYTTDGYKPINKYLRGESTTLSRKLSLVAAAVDRLMRPIEEPYTSYRGIGMNRISDKARVQFMDAEKGQAIMVDSYWSTSRDITKASSFSSGDVVIEMHPDISVPCITLSNDDTPFPEHETIYGNGLRLVIDDVKRNVWVGEVMTKRYIVARLTSGEVD